MAALTRTPLKGGKKQNKRVPMKDITNNDSTETNQEVSVYNESSLNSPKTEEEAIETRDEFLICRDDFLAKMRGDFQKLFNEFENDVQSLYDDVDKIVVEMADRLKTEQEKLFSEVNQRFNDLERTEKETHELIESSSKIMEKIQQAFLILTEEGFMNKNNL
eukprot:GHVP01068930.1.p1 GENE.GHVP01068930.1~~GHVP01068930.1.p1  ORF type:complete len:162 (+),score=39.51 GHVP01068930.1:502-987(+)